MKMPRTIEEALEVQRRLDAMKNCNDAYVNEESRWKASRFAMDIIREISIETGRTLSESYQYLQSGNSIEDYILGHYEIMHTQDFQSTIQDVNDYVRSHSHAV